MFLTSQKVPKIASLSFLCRATPVLAQLERKVFRGSQGLRAVKASLASQALATLELLVFPERLEILVYLVQKGNQVYLDQGVSEAKEDHQKQVEVLLC